MTDTYALESAVHRQTATRPEFWGYYLARHRRRHDLSVYDQAVRLKLTEGQLASLALCLAPRPEHRAADLAEVAGYLNCREKWLEALWMEVDALS